MGFLFFSMYRSHGLLLLSHLNIYSLLRFLFLSVFDFSSFFSAALFFGLAVTDVGIMFPSMRAPVLLGTFSPVAFALSLQSLASSAEAVVAVLLLEPAVVESFGAKFSRDSDLRNSTFAFMEWISVINFARLAKLS